MTDMIHTGAEHANEKPSEKLVFTPEGEVQKTYVPTPQYDTVEALVIHKIDFTATMYKGNILTLRMKPTTNGELAEEMGILLCQYLAMLSHSHNIIHHPYKSGEQAHCFIEPGLPVKPPQRRTVTIRDKYWGDREIECAVNLATVLAKRHGWIVEDERQSLLVRIAQAAATEGD